MWRIFSPNQTLLIMQNFVITVKTLAHTTHEAYRAAINHFSPNESYDPQIAIQNENLNTKWEYLSDKNKANYEVLIESILTGELELKSDMSLLCKMACAVCQPFINRIY